MGWTIQYSRQAKKTLNKKGGKLLSEDARDAMNALHLDLEVNGPAQPSWPNYSKLSGRGKNIDLRHCHLVRGNPTYVACWEVKDKKQKIMEVFYVGTHEKAPY